MCAATFITVSNINLYETNHTFYLMSLKTLKCYFLLSNLNVNSYSTAALGERVGLLSASHSLTVGNPSLMTLQLAAKQSDLSGHNS